MKLRSRKHGNLSAYSNKDGSFFPLPVVDPDGSLALALIHRPMYLIARSDGTVERRVPDGIEESRQSIWLSYVPLAGAVHDVRGLLETSDSVLLATPKARLGAAEDRRRSAAASHR